MLNLVPEDMCSATQVDTQNPYPLHFFRTTHELRHSGNGRWDYPEVEGLAGATGTAEQSLLGEATCSQASVSIINLNHSGHK